MNNSFFWPCREVKLYCMLVREVGELPISVEACRRNSLVATFAALGMILGAMYSLWLIVRFLRT